MKENIESGHPVPFNTVCQKKVEFSLVFSRSMMDYKIQGNYCLSIAKDSTPKTKAKSEDENTITS